MIDPVLLMLNNLKEDQFALSLERQESENHFFGIWEDESLGLAPIIFSEGTGLFIGRHGYSGMGDYYSNTHGNTGQGWF